MIQEFSNKIFSPSKIYILFILLILVASNGYSRAKIEGVIIDVITKKPIPNVSIQILPGNLGTTTDENGHFSLTLPFGEYNVFVSVVGYYKKNKYVNLKDDITLNFELTEEIKNFEEVIVKGQRADANVNDVQMGSIQLNMKNLRKIPVVFGETDILKALTLQPGITTVGEGAGGLNVRGGRVDQNLVLLDGAPLFNTSHLLGFFTSTNADVIQDVTLYKAGIPANFGGRLSALINMTTKEGNNEKINFQAGLGTISGRFSAEGPIIKNKLTFAAGGRIAYPNLAIKYFPGNIGKSRAFFYDGNAKFSLRINEKSKISASGYQSYDDFKFAEDTIYSWSTTQATIHYNLIINKLFSFNASALFSNYQFDINGFGRAIEFKLHSTILQKEAKTSLLFTPSSQLKIETGASIIKYDISPGTQTPIGTHSNINAERLATEAAREMSSFATADYELNKTFSIQAGLRYSLFQNLGAKTVYLYQPGELRLPESIIDSILYKKGQPVQLYGGVEPRLSLKIGLSESSSIKFSYNKMRQYLNLISNTTAISPVDFWKLSDSYIPPQISQQMAVGIFKNFDDNNIEVSLEGYYKILKNLIEYKKGARLIKNPLLETALLDAKGKSYGVEFSIKKNRGDFTGIASYTYSRTLVAVITPFAIETINNGNYYPAGYDKPHNIAVSTVYNIGRGFTFASNFTYQTGRPISYPDGSYSFNGLPIINYTKRNLDRIPDYHRMDLSISLDSRKVKEQKKYNVFVFSIYNLYGRKNPYSVYFTSNNLVTKANRLSVFGVAIPSFTINKYF
jgi:CarboxypepD_reg-like domain/TonB-dependent Receptor Plug Domain